MSENYIVDKKNKILLDCGSIDIRDIYLDLKRWYEFKKELEKYRHEEHFINFVNKKITDLNINDFNELINIYNIWNELCFIDTPSIILDYCYKEDITLENIEIIGECIPSKYRNFEIR